MPEYQNPKNHAIYLAGPDGKVIKIGGKKKVTLPDYFEKYRSRGFIKLAMEQKQPKIVKTTKIVTQKSRPTATAKTIRNARRTIKLNQRQAIKKAAIVAPTKNSTIKIQQRRVVGRQSPLDPNVLLHENLNGASFSISNNIGVGILSYNRPECLHRLISTIISHTDLKRTTVFISDDNSTNQDSIKYLNSLSKDPRFVVIKNTERLGIAGNSNRLLRCLSRFAYGLILNDDVEILTDGWDSYFPTIMNLSGLHHMMHHEEGVYGGRKLDTTLCDNIEVRIAHEKPQGAVLAFTNHYIKNAGYFDESYGIYGMEHVDWSSKAFEFDIHRKRGYFAPIDSNKYFKTHAEKSAVEERSTKLAAAREIYSKRIPVKCEPTEKTRIPTISYVVPFRNTTREDSILSVINNLRAQKYPAIELILSEQDHKTNININNCEPVVYCLYKQNCPFNKSKAFNLGVSKATSDKIILHDADMLMVDNYTSNISEILDTYESCHIGKNVMYLSKESTNAVNQSCVVNKSAICDRSVGYFEGGSLACRRSTYWNVGGFNEEFEGYGVEDCDFYYRLSKHSHWLEQRTFDLLHLWHDRTPGWENHHSNNKAVAAKLNLLSVSERVSRQHTQLRAAGYE